MASKGIITQHDWFCVTLELFQTDKGVTPRKTALNKNKEKSHPAHSAEDRSVMNKEQKEGAE